MMYWDSSAILPLVVEEEATARCEARYREDSQVVTWWATRIECASALNRLHREGTLGDEEVRKSLADLTTLAATWIEVQPTEKVRDRALRLLRVHPLRAADALQLAASLVASSENPQALPFVSNDERLTAAAIKEGFPIA